METTFRLKFFLMQLAIQNKFNACVYLLRLTWFLAFFIRFSRRINMYIKSQSKKGQREKKGKRTERKKEQIKVKYGFMIVCGNTNHNNIDEILLNRTIFCAT